MEEEGVFRVKRKHVYLIVAVVLIFSAGFAVKSLSTYLPGAEDEVVCSGPGRCEKSTPATEAPPVLLSLADVPPVSKEEMGNKVMDYLNETFLVPQGAEGEIADVRAIGDNLYLVDILIKKEGVTQRAPIYVTKDGKLILLGDGGGIVDLYETSGLDLQAPTVTQTVPPTQTTVKEAEIDISDAAYVSGPEDAAVTMIEFNDFQCPFCKRFRDQTLDQVLGQYGERIKYVLMDFPITSIHPQAFIAHVAARCAGDQDRYFEYHDKLFANQGAWSRFTPDSEDELKELKKYASELSLDTVAFNECLDSKKYSEAVSNNMEKGVNAGVSGTPSFFVNGIKIVGAQPYQVFQQVIEVELSK